MIELVCKEIRMLEIADKSRNQKGLLLALQRSKGYINIHNR